MAENEQIGNMRPGLAEAVAEGVNSRLNRVHVGMPARVLAFYHDRGECDLEVGIKDLRKLPNGKVTALEPVKLRNVPIIYPAGGDFVLKFPLKVNDTVHVLFMDRDMDPWYLGPEGVAAAPKDVGRRFDFNDAVCIPGLRQAIRSHRTQIDELYIGREDGASGIRVVTEHGVHQILLGSVNNDPSYLGPDGKAVTPLQRTILGDEFRSRFEEALKGSTDQLDSLGNDLATHSSTLTPMVSGSGGTLTGAAVANALNDIASALREVSSALKTLRDGIPSMIAKKVYVE